MYWDKTLVCKKGFILCLMCYLLKGEETSIKKDNDEMKQHCHSQHQSYGILCKKRGCLARGKTNRDIGLHQFLCHGMS
uniref:Secreted protein n=1 Tax=Arundo donax TaxID=35708 RepID=A0A0A9I0E9_ARUDO